LGAVCETKPPPPPMALAMLNGALGGVCLLIDDCFEINNQVTQELNI